MSAPIRYFLFLLALTGLAAAVMLSGPGVAVTFHIGDILHALEASVRIMDGELPHLDFMTPIGILAFAPISLFLAAGFGPGESLVLANTLVTLALLPVIAYVALGRLAGWSRWLFGAALVVLLMAFIYGGTDAGVSFSMHYNRWAWAISFLVLVTAIWPPAGKAHPVLDALVIGGGMAVLALLKMTFFMAFGVSVLLILLLDRKFRLLALSALVGLAVALVVTLLFGLDYWFAYADNLLQVALHSPRPNPDRPFVQTLAAPDRKLGTLVYIVAIILLRLSGAKRAGTVLLLLAPAFFYVVYQNFGNEQKWLPFLALFLLANLPATGARRFFGVDARQIANVLTIVSLTIAIPTVLALFSSIIGVAQVDKTAMKPYPFARMQQDIWLDGALNFVLLTANYRPTEQQLSAIRQNTGDFPVSIQSFQGEELPLCGLQAGYVQRDLQAIALLQTQGVPVEKQVVLADNTNSIWLASEYARPKGGSPWYYSGGYGYENADYYLIPLCPVMSVARGESLKAMQESGWKFAEIGRSDQFVLYRIDK